MTYASRSGWVAYHASGVSMGRRWRDAERLIGEQASDVAIRWSDVVIADLEGRLVAHRVVRKVRRPCGTVLVTKGDGSLFPDRIPVPADRVIAVVRALRCGDKVHLVAEGAARWSGCIHAAWGWCASWFWRPLESLKRRDGCAE